MIPSFSVVGERSNVGKTTVICNIIAELKNRGYRVGTIKHDVHGFEIDKEGKDTWLHAKAGADIVAISSYNKMAIIEKVQKEYTLNEMLEKINNVDIVIVEGYKNENNPKLEVFRKGVSEKLNSKEEDLFCIITDTVLEANVPQFGFDDVKDVVDLIENTFIIN